MSALGLTEGAYDVGSKPIVAQECVNLYPEFMEGRARAPVVLRGTPGLKEFSTDLGDGPVRGMIVMSGILYCVSGTSLFAIASSGLSTLIGTIEGNGRVGMAVNANDELIIVNGTTTGYLYDLSTLSEIANFPGADVVHFLDNYFIVNKPDTREFYISGTSDGSTWNALDFASKEGSPYNLVSLIPNHRDLFLFGERTYEVWRNTGNIDFPFQRQEGTFQERGCGARHSVVDLDNTVYFVGDDRMVYSVQGYQPVRVSNHGVEEALESASAVELENATAFTYTQRGHYFYVLNLGSDTWVYDATFSNQTGRSTWHKRRSGVGSGRWRGENYAHHYGKHLVGDYNSNTIWELDENTESDGDAEIERIRTIAPIFSDIRPVACPRLELKLSGGVGSKVWLEISRDGGRTWGPRKERSTGDVGDYREKVVWRRLGKARDWLFRFSTTDMADVQWIEAYGDLEVGQG
jgi:hypothetical protein